MERSCQERSRLTPADEKTEVVFINERERCAKADTAVILLVESIPSSQAEPPNNGTRSTVFTIDLLVLLQ